MVSGNNNPYDQISKTIEPISLEDVETNKVKLPLCHRMNLQSLHFTNIFVLHATKKNKVPQWQQNCKAVDTRPPPQIDERIFDFPSWTSLDDTSEVCQIY